MFNYLYIQWQEQISLENSHQQESTNLKIAMQDSKE